MLDIFGPTDLLLITVSFFTSFITAAIGIGGGTLLLAVMAQVLPAGAIIPIHGVVQAGSNFGRSFLLFAYVHWRLVVVFVLGAFIGAYVGGQIVISLPPNVLKLILGIFILFSVWGPKLKQSRLSVLGLGIGGVLTTLLTMFVGATGPFVLSLIRTFGLSPGDTVATNSVCVMVQHVFKIAVFGLLGFNFAPYATLVVAMIAFGFAGTYLGKIILLKSPPKRFDQLLKLVLSVLAVRLIIPL